MDTLLLVLSLVAMLVGLVGSVVPALPGPPLSWVGILLFYFVSFSSLSLSFLIVTGVVALLLVVLDYVIPSLSTKRFGGSKAGVWGCNIGLLVSLVGLPFLPEGFVCFFVWPLVGAWIGELIQSRSMHVAVRSAVGSFLGFLTGTLLKVAYGFFALVAIIVAWINA